MTTRLAPQRQFIISTRSAVASASASAVVVDAIQAEAAEELQQQQLQEDVLTVEVENTNHTAATSVSTSPTHAEQFEFCTEDGVVVSATLEDVMTQNCQLLQKKLSEGDDTVTGTANGAEQLEVIRVVLPMDASDSSNEAHAHIHGHVVNSSSDIGGTITTTEPNGSTITHSIPLHSMADLSAIKNGVDLAQQVANGQVTVVQATEDDDGTPFITVTVSGQEQNYQVQYVDSELYHSNSSQTQMTYPFCPVGDYQGNGQTYYSTSTSTGQYAATTPSAGGNAAGNAAHSTTLPYLVPVEEGLLLNGSSQSHSRDSPHSLTVSRERGREWEPPEPTVTTLTNPWATLGLQHEVAYIQEAQSTPQTPTSTTTTNSASGGSLGTGGGGASPDSDQSALGNSNKIASATIKWLSRNYETADGVSLPRSTLYNHYMQHCNEQKLEPVNAASFGKLIRSVFSGLRTRRLGTRGNSKYHYYGIRIKPGSLLNHHSMEDTKSMHGYGPSAGNGALVSVSSSTSGQIAGSNGSMGMSGSTGQRNGTSKKHSFKPETYEACIQYIGDGGSALPSFPPIELSHSFSTELTLEDVDTFRALYREHCESFLDAVLNLEFGTVEFLLRDFWRSSDNNNLEECEEEKYLSKTKLYLLCHCAEVQKFVREVDYQFYQNTVDVIIPDVLRSIPNALTQAIRNFAKNLELWLCESMMGVPEQLAQIKTSAVSAFCQTLRRYTSLNHLAQAARAVLQNGAQISQMLSDLNRVDFHNVQEQAAWVSQCAPAVVQRLESDFKAALQQQSSLEQWASWLQLVVESAMEEYTGKPTYARAARQFLLKWSFYSSMIIRDLTLRSASSFGSFHLIRLLFDEYMFYLVEHKIAEAQQKTAIAVICERMKKEMDFEFECQFAYITSETEQQNTPSSVSGGGDVGNEAKRLKQE
ncbi:DNA-binding protein RFX2 isoform X1 [Drosophila obscura]|uniref:DNA-binding protein RFX2 isoform X1 n=1 Tax=Drosophila obscura TaxID=7282 RepID=UPI001BB1C720|nr:DNA-binding protein RFX2 isoform X1 [Drosophila obscura]XP_022210771.2 DNA-binding protein RFX2 isoform X1 [Drosophila obscura]